MIFEGGVHAGNSIDEMLDKWDARLRETFAEELGERVFETPEWERQAVAMEEMFPAAVPDEDLPQAESDGAAAP